MEGKFNDLFSDVFNVVDLKMWYVVVIVVVILLVISLFGFVILMFFCYIKYVDLRYYNDYFDYLN